MTVISSSAWSALSFYLMLVTVVPIGLLLAPQPVNRDKRVIVALIVLIVLAIGMPLFAFESNVCTYAWWALECWLYGK